MTISNQ